MLHQPAVQRLCNTLTTFYMKCKALPEFQSPRRIRRVVCCAFLQVLGEEAQSSRLLLCEATRKALDCQELLKYAQIVNAF